MVFLAFLLGVLGGAAAVFILMYNKIRAAREWEKTHNELMVQKKNFDERVIKYHELEDENNLLKQDLQNLDVQVRKLRMDTKQQERMQEDLDKRVQEVGQRYLKETVTWVGKTLNTNNFAKCKERLVKCIERVRAIGFDVPKAEEDSLVQDLKSDYEKVVRADFERQEQARIKAQIREEQKREKEIERELQALDREREAIQAALEKALAEAKDEHAEEVQRLRKGLPRPKPGPNAPSRWRSLPALATSMLSRISDHSARMSTKSG